MIDTAPSAESSDIDEDDKKAEIKEEARICHELDEMINTMEKSKPMNKMTPEEW